MRKVHVQAGRGLPFVSLPQGSKARPGRNASDVSATGIPIVPKCETPAPTRNVAPAATNRPADVAKENALARHCVRYCSGSQSVNTQKLAPPTPTRKSAAINETNAPR